MNVYTDNVTTENGTVNSRTFLVPGSSRYVSLAAIRLSGSTDITVTLQGSFDGQSWADTALTGTLTANGTLVLGASPGTPIAFPRYRVELVGTGAGQAQVYATFN